ncbi:MULTISPECIES: hypothetical protein [Bacillus cereus group]
MSVFGYYYLLSLSYRDVPKDLKERGMSVQPTIIMRCFANITV